LFILTIRNITVMLLMSDDVLKLQKDVNCREIIIQVLVYSRRK